MAAFMSSGHATDRLHARPAGQKKKMRIAGGPVAAVHKEAGRKLVREMAAALPVLTQPRTELVAGLRASLLVCASNGFQAGAKARGRLLRLEAGERRLAALPTFGPRPAFIVPSGQARDLISLLQGAEGARRPMVATPRARPFPRDQFVDAPGATPATCPLSPKP